MGQTLHALAVFISIEFRVYAGPAGWIPSCTFVDFFCGGGVYKGFICIKLKDVVSNSGGQYLEVEVEVCSPQ